LQTLAEIAIAVAGFTAIIGIFQRVNRAQNELARWRIYTVLTTSFGALFAATLPMGLSLVRVEQPGLWRISSGIGAVITLLIYGDLLRTRSKLSAASQKIVAGHPWYVRLTTASGVSITIAHLMNASTAIFAAPSGVYFFCVLGGIAISCTIFGRTVFGPQPSEELPAV